MSNDLLARVSAEAHIPITAFGGAIEKGSDMRDDFYSKDWADNHHKLGDPIDKFFKGIEQAFGVLSAVQFDAPWRRARTGGRKASAR